MARGSRRRRGPALADGVARFCGEAVAVVVAANPYVAADARDLVTVEWEPRPAVATIDQALASNQILFQRRHRQGDVDGAFARASIVVRETFEHGRCAPSPLEVRGILADWDGEALTIWSGNQSPSLMRTALADALSLPQARVRIVCPDVGGGFGLKMQVFPEDVAVAALTRRLGRPVKWLEERRENLTAASQARGQRTTVEVAAAADGTVLALRSRVMSDNGAYHAYPTTGVLEPLGTASIMPGPYRISAYEFEALALATHKPPLGAYRGVGMTMGAFVAERMLDLVAERLSLDPAEIRRRNLIPREAYPFTSATGYTYDSGDFPKALEEALGAGRLRQAPPRAEGRARRRTTRRDRDRVLHRIHGDGIRGLPSSRRGRDARHRGRDRHRGRRRDGPVRVELPDAGPGPRDDHRADRRRSPGAHARRHPAAARRHGRVAAG
jgi:carbon-monoxide dehydrogenase large subunit